MANRNIARSSNAFFGMTILDRDFTYAVQRVNIPGISFQNINISKMFTQFPLQGDTPQFENLQISLILDEQFNVWKKLFELKNSMTNSNTSQAKLENFEAFLFIYDEKDNLTLQLNFHHCVLQSIGSVDFDTTSDAILILPITIEYAFYDTKEDNKHIKLSEEITILKNTIVQHDRKELQQ